MPQTIAEGTRHARKVHRCGMCDLPIQPGDRYAYQTCVYDGRAYTFRDCYWCDRDRVVNYVWDWVGGTEEGVSYEQAVEWAEEAIGWPKHWIAYCRPITSTERQAARAWIARATQEATDDE